MHPGKFVLAALACAAIGGACAQHQRPATQPLDTTAYVRPAVRVRYVERVWDHGRLVSQGTVRAPWSGPANPVRAQQAQYVTEQQRRMDEIGALVRGQSDRGAVERWARERDYVNRLLSQYTADGQLTPDEQRHIETSVFQMRETVPGAVAAPAVATTARGGGPAAQPARRTRHRAR